MRFASRYRSPKAKIKAIGWGKSIHLFKALSSSLIVFQGKSLLSDAAPAELILVAKEVGFEGIAASGKTHRTNQVSEVAHGLKPGSDQVVESSGQRCAVQVDSLGFQSLRLRN